MQTQEELNAIKEEVENMNQKLNELNNEELAQVVGDISNSKPYGLSSSAIDVSDPLN